MKIVTLLKTTAAVATLMMGSQTWGAGDDTAYDTGAVSNGVRHDRVTLGVAGDFTGFAYSAEPIYTLYIDFTTGDGTAAANDTNTGADKTKLPSTIKDLWLTGSFTNYATAVGSTAAWALPTPPEGARIHFLLADSPSAAPALLFQANIPSSCEIIIEPGSADPVLSTILASGGQGASIKSLSLGANIALAAGTYAMPIIRHKDVKESEVATKATITPGGAATFNGPLKGVRLVGGTNAMNFNEGAELVDPTAGAATWTVGAGKSLAIKEIGASFNPGALTTLTLNSKAKFSIQGK
jgi:hypothetical protein